MKTPITELFAIEHPVVLPGMSWISTPALVAAVSEAGGLGILASGPLSPAETRSSIREIRQRTDKPFGVGLALLMPGAKENAAVALEEQVPVINFSLGKGDWLIEAAHGYGGKVIATVVSEKHARSAEKMGADALLVTGHEAAAHGGDVTSLVLIPALADKVSIPIIATGGFADGRGLLAALSLGASAIAMGSRLAVSSESPLHSQMKAAIIERDEQQTLYSKNFDGIPSRVMKSPRTVRLARRPMGFFATMFEAARAAKVVNQPIWKVVLAVLARVDQVRLLAYFGASVPKIQAATVDGDLEHGVQFVGQTQGLIRDEVSAAQIIERTLAEARAVHHRHQELWS